MASLMEITQLCRLCLVKDQVNIPIFEEPGDIRQIFLKISACLPVKVAREDNLPKKICDGCSYKLEMFYEFWNTSASSEKQLLKWLEQVGIDKLPTSSDKSAQPQSHSINTDGVVLKQEVLDLGETHGDDDELPTDDLNVPTDPEYLLQQQSYQSFEFQTDGFNEGETASAAGPSSTITSGAAASAAPKRKRRAAAMKPLPPQNDSEDEDDTGLIEPKIAKTEEQSDDSAGEDHEPTTFVGLPDDNEQPGPSGVGKAATSSDAPFDHLTESEDDTQHQTIYECEVCTQIFSTKKEFLTHHMSQYGDTFNCCRCGLQFKTTTELYNHYELHKNSSIIVEGEEEEETAEFDYTENVEAVMNIPNEPINDTEELLYILDGNQCINEVVIEQDSEVQETESENTSSSSAIRPENYTIVQVEHGYMLPSVFKGQLESKRRYTKKRESISGFGGDDDSEELEVVTKPEPTPSSRAITTSSSSSVPKIRPKRRHEVPDFSATNYVVLNPNEEVDILHYKCLRCEQLFINKFGFFRHIEKGKCYINSCDACSASFSRNSEFYDHYLAEHTDRAICNFCFRTFMYEKNVKEHMLRHLDQFRHRCEECNKGFYTVREYRNHYKNRHMGIRHKCDVCGRSFADEYYFKRHVATHEKAAATKLGFSVTI